MAKEQPSAGLLEMISPRSSHPLASAGINSHHPSGPSYLGRTSVQTLVAEVLAAWRSAERLTKTLAEGTPEHRAATAACERLRDLYRDLTLPGGAPPRQGGDPARSPST